MSDEQDQMLDGPTKQVGVTARPFRDSDLESVEAVTMPVRSAKQKRLASELDQRGAERTAELAKASDEMRGEIGERREIKAHLLESEAALHSSLLSADRASAKLTDPREFPNKCCAEFRQLAKLRQSRLQLSSE